MAKKSGMEALLTWVGRSSVQKATLVEELPANEKAFRYELKWDGYRILAVKCGGEVRLISRAHQDWTESFRSIATAVATLDAEECVIDGEVCALDEHGLPSFQMLQQRQRTPRQLIFAVFDLLWLEGQDVRDRTLEGRRELVERLAGTTRDPSIIVSQQFDDDPAQILATACERGLEGIIAKQRGSKYVGARASTWLKIKCKRRQEFAIAGYLPLLGHKDAVGGLVLALHDEAGFYFAGKVGTGFTEKARYELGLLLDRDRVERSKARSVPKFGGLVRHCEPKLVCEVQFAEWTGGGHVRHPSFRGLRADKKPEDCVREVPQSPGDVPVAPKRAPQRRTAATSSNASSSAVEVAGVSISHPNRVLTPLQLTKLELARYYESVAKWMLPHVQNRPLGLVQHRRDREHGLYLRHDAAFGPHELTRVQIPLQKKVGHYLVVDAVAGLVALANFEIIEVHTWMSRMDDLERPDRLVFDLDPDEALPWARVVESAAIVRDRLAGIGLRSWPRLTGGKGVHVVVPMTPGPSYDECLAFARAFAKDVQARDPARFVTQPGAARRKDKVLLDVLRNARASTAIESYSTRARPGTPVCVPISWDELTPELVSHHFDVERVARRLLEGGEPWRGYWRAQKRGQAALRSWSPKR
jgi:bifunctional non-homologous end joining protein LigD